MAVVALRISFVLVVSMTVGTIHLGVNVIQVQTSDGVPKVRLVPALVAAYAHRVEFGNLLTGRVTGPAIKLFVVLIERPSGRVV